LPDPKDFTSSDTISIHISQLVKETSTLHKVISKYLHPDALKSILSQIFRCYVIKLEEDFRRIDLFSSAAKNRLLIDVQYLITELSSLDGVDGLGNHLEVCINNIKIKIKIKDKDKGRKNSFAASNTSPDKKGVPALPTPKNPPSNFANK
jgi:hypothetical protein